MLPIVSIGSAEIYHKVTGKEKIINNCLQHATIEKEEKIIYLDTQTNYLYVSLQHASIASEVVDF